MGLVSQAALDESTDSGVGSANAAELTIGGVRKLVGVHWESTGAATLNVEVMIDGSWETFDTVAISAAGSDIEVYEVPYDDIRAYLDANRTKVVVTSGGVS